MGENDRRRIPVGQLLKTLSLDFHGERVDIRLFFITDDDDPARLGMLIEARQLQARTIDIRNDHPSV